MFCLFFFMFVFLFALWCFELCLVSMLCCSYCIMFVLDMHTSLCYCALLVSCSDDYLLCHMIIVVISIWLFLFDQVAHMFHNMFTCSYFTCYIILVILSLDLPWGSNVFCASVSGNRYLIPSASQLLDLGVSEFFHCSQTHV